MGEHKADSLWNNENSARALKLYGDGFSAAQIARDLGPAFSRNSVIGKLHRLSATSARRATAGSATAGLQRKLAAQASAGVTKAARPAAPRVAPTPAAPAAARPLRSPPGSHAQPVPLLKLKFAICRFPVNSPEPGYGESTLFCGEPVRDVMCPYCAPCALIAFKAPKGPQNVGPSADRRRFNGRQFPGGGQPTRYAQ